MKGVFALGVVLFIACTQQATAPLPNKVNELNLSNEPVNVDEYAIFSCTFVNSNWTFRIEYPDVMLERSFKAEDACRMALEEYVDNDRNRTEVTR